MKRRNACLLFLLCATLFTGAWAHKQHVHQYLTKEAYTLVQQRVGGDVPVLKDRIGGLEQYYAGDRDWQRQVLTTGAWREDIDDIIYGNTGDYSSITHFFKADDGDNCYNDFRYDGIYLGTYPNAYMKIKLFEIANNTWKFEYSDGGFGHVSTFAKAGGGYVSYTWYTALGFAYTSLVDMYVNGNARIVGYYDVNGQWISQSQRPDILPRDVILGQGWRDAFVWELLGRMGHLIQDMSVPAHAHAAMHPQWYHVINGSDGYEDWVGNDDNHHLAWSGQNSGALLDPYLSSNPLHYLMYTTQQMADHFGCNTQERTTGNDVIGGNVLPEELTYLQAQNISSFGGPYDGSGPWDDPQYVNIRDHTEPAAIRATAGLMYWFATEAGLLSKASIVTSMNGGTLTVDSKNVSSGYIEGVRAGTTVTVSAPASQIVNGSNYIFSSWQQLSPTGALIASSSNQTWTATVSGKCTLKAVYLNPLSAILTGPTLQYGQTGTYTTTASGGTPPYSYAWWIQYPGGGELMVDGGKVGMGDDVLPNLPPPGDTWYACGSNSATLSHTAYQSFGFKCYVTDAAQATVMAGPLYNYLGSGGAMMAKEGTATLQASVSSLAEELPTESSLAAAYPNPFNPTTTLRFALKENAHVTLAVYDALGREVATLAKAPHGAGYYQYQWNASTASSGIYFARLTVDTGNKSSSFSKMTKLLLVK